MTDSSLLHSQGTSEIKIICLDFPLFEKKMVEWDGMAFQKTENLKTLIIRNGIFSDDPKCFPNSLRVLEWWRYPSHCLPSYFQPKQLAICKLPHSLFMSFQMGGLSKASLHCTLSTSCKLINSF